MQAGVEQHNLQPAPRRRVALQHRGDVFAHQSEEGKHAYTVTGSVSCDVTSSRTCWNSTLLR